MLEVCMPLLLSCIYLLFYRSENEGFPCKSGLSSSYAHLHTYPLVNNSRFRVLGLSLGGIQHWKTILRIPDGLVSQSCPHSEIILKLWNV
jgi:hypothetical protein